MIISSDSITLRMQRLFDSASSLILTNIKIDALEHIDKLEVHCCCWTQFFNYWTIRTTLVDDIQGSSTECADTIGLIMTILVE